MENYKKIDILLPEGEIGQLQTDFFMKEAKEKNIKINKKILYKSGDFDSMNKGILELANLNSSKRLQNKISELWKKNIITDTKLERINHTSIILEPEIKADALFLPDNFRIVKHFSKLMKYHNIKNLPLIGGNEWRDISLVRPENTLISRSFFVDFM